MRTVHVAATRPYDVQCGGGALRALADLITVRRAIVVADEHVADLHAERLPAQLHADLIRIPRGESAKTFAELGRLLERLADARLDRRSIIVALGGGATSDLAGLAAALYMRGIDWIACPTTLLSQVDAAVGGKTAIDLPQAKNLVGAFHQPLAVLADLDVLSTLDDIEYRSGLGELVKHAILDGEDAFAHLERNAVAIHDRDPAALAEAIPTAVAVKARIVAADERETGERETLNLGHTFAHAIEHTAGFGVVPHGLAVAVGIALAIRFSADLGHLEQPDLLERYTALAEALGLPTSPADLNLPTAALDPAAWTAAMRLDKKAAGEQARLVLPRALGSVQHGIAVPLDDLKRRLLRLL